MRRRSALSLRRTVRAAQRQALIFAASCIVGVLLGALYAFFAHGDAESVAAWTGFGAACGLALATAREAGRGAISDFDLITTRTGLPVLGAAPTLAPDSLRELSPDLRTPFGGIVFFPASRFASAYRDLNDALAGHQLIACIGSSANDGASTTAACLAASAAQQGKRVLILDCDRRRRTLTQMFGFDPEHGVIEILDRPEDWASAVLREAEIGIHLLGMARESNPWRDLFVGESLPRLFDLMRDNYDLIVLDCPPALMLAEGAMIAQRADACVVVAAWDETPLSALRATARTLQRQSPLSTGVFVNRMPGDYRFEAA